MSSINIGIEETEQPMVQQPTQTTNSVSKIIEDLIKAVCDESTAEYQYIIAGHIARGAGYCDVVPEYEQHANEEREHKLKLLKRLEQLGYKFSLDLIHLSSNGNSWTPITTSNISEQLGILINAESEAQTFYKQIIEDARAENDEITKQLIKQLLADECEHETDLRRIAEGL